MQGEYRDCIRIMEKKMESTFAGQGFEAEGLGIQVLGSCKLGGSQACCYWSDLGLRVSGLTAGF